MAVYAIGDIQGCHVTLMRLLDRIRFDRRTDRLLLVGDLVNRGPRSLEVLRWARSLDDRHVVVLGNHDLHLLGRAEGGAPAARRDTLDAVLGASDRTELLDWLRGRPMLFHEGDVVVVHAGLLPSWTVRDAEAIARDLEGALRGPDWGDRVGGWVTARAARVRWSDDLVGEARRAVAAAAFTRLRVCAPDGTLCLDHDGPPAEAPDGCRAWFEHPSARGGATVLFGHWSALGYHVATGAVCLDSGCVWGRTLTALRLDDRAVFSEPYEE